MTDNEQVEQALPTNDLPQSKQETAAETKEAPDLGEAIDTALAGWMNNSIRGGSPIARNTPSYNYLQQQLPVLKALLMKEITA